MKVEENQNNLNEKVLHDGCNDLLYYHVIMTLKDGSTIDGIIGKVNDDEVIVLVGEDITDSMSERTDERYHAHSPGRFRRFAPRSFPFASVAALSLLAYPLLASAYP